MNTPSARRLTPVAFAAAALAAGLTACSDKPSTVTPSDSVSSEKVEALEREVAKMREDAGALKGTTLSSSEGLSLASQIKDLKVQIAELQARNAALASMNPGTGGSPAGGPNSGGSNTGGTASTSSSGIPVGPYGAVPIPTDPAQPIPAETITAFRRISDEVDKIKQSEQQAKRLKDELTRAGVTLSAEQEAALVKVQSAYSDKIRELYRNGGGATDGDRTALAAQRDAIRAQYENEIRTVVPASDADKIIETLNRGGRQTGPGVPRNFGGGGMNGMGG